MGIMSRVCPGNWGSFPGQVIPKTQKMVLDTALLNTQKGAFGSSSTKVINFTYIYIYIYV